MCSERRCAASRLQVSLMVPWIAEAAQKVLFKDNVHFSTPQEQVAHGASRRHVTPGPCWAHYSVPGAACHRTLKCCSCGAGLREGDVCHKEGSGILPWCCIASDSAIACAQVKHIFQWVKDRAGFEASFRVIFYPAEYNKRMLGVFPIGDPIPYVPEEEVRTSSNAAYSNS